MRETDRADGRLKRIALNIFAEIEKEYGAKQTEENCESTKENSHALVNTQSCYLTLFSALEKD